MALAEGAQKDIVQDTKKYIIKIARDLFSEYSYLGVSMNDIAKKLNITKAALYYHFTDKADIYKKVLDEVFNGLSISINGAFVEKTADQKLHKLIKGYLDFGSKEKNLIKALMLKFLPAEPQIRNYVIRLRKQTADLIQPLIREIMINQRPGRKADSYLVTSLLTGMMDGVLLEYSFLNKKINSEKITKQIVAVLF